MSEAVLPVRLLVLTLLWPVLPNVSTSGHSVRSTSLLLSRAAMQPGSPASAASTAISTATSASPLLGGRLSYRSQLSTSAASYATVVPMLPDVHEVSDMASDHCSDSDLDSDLDSGHGNDATPLLKPSIAWARTTPRHSMTSVTMATMARRAVANTPAAADAAHDSSHPTVGARTSRWNVLQYLPAVLLGLIMNLLDAMSYGYIVFPISDAAFAGMGSDGISMTLVSTIVSQLVYSTMSRFKGGNGSMMIEVIPFLHVMCRMIHSSASDPRSVMPTVMVAFVLSSAFTAAAFFLLGGFKLGQLMGFFPRHILVGSIGGVGYFLMETALEVTTGVKLHVFSAPLESARALFSPHAWPLWTSSLAVALLLRVLLLLRAPRCRAIFHHPLFVPLFFLLVPIVFYMLAMPLLGCSLAQLRALGWLFDLPADKPFYHFYSYFDTSLVDWSLIFPKLLPTMLSLTFFSVLHVPINVPALAVSTRMDDVPMTRELLVHGASNLAAACTGSLQNYLVYSNSVLFYRSGGGKSRLAGFMLAAATAAVWVSGSVVFRLMPVLVVGSLIFHLGIDLLKEAVWDTVGLVTRLEYGTIWAIIVAMAGIGFTEGVGVGVVLASLFFVVTYSTRSVIRSERTGEVYVHWCCTVLAARANRHPLPHSVRSTVRRMYRQLQYLNHVGSQIHILQLQGFIFFGTIHQLDKKMRHYLRDQFVAHPIRFLVIDMRLCQDMDFSAGEAFVRIVRKLADRDIVLVLSGVSGHSHIGMALRRAGVWQTQSGVRHDGTEPAGVVKCFGTLNEALEWCENCLLESLYQVHAELQSSSAINIAPSAANSSTNTPLSSFSVTPPTLSALSYRRQQLWTAAATVMRQGMHME